MDLAQVESLCQTMYGPTSTPEARFSAHKTLLFLQISSSYVNHCRYLLQHSSDPPTLLYATQSLSLIMRRDLSNFSLDARLSLRDFLVEILNAAGNPRHFLTKKLIQVLCEVVRRSWCEDPRQRTILDQCAVWIGTGGVVAQLGLRVVGELVEEFDQSRFVAPDALARRANVAFREQGEGLMRSFFLALDAVWASREARDVGLLVESLRCLLASLSFDFAGTGTSTDESSTNVPCAFLPKAWVASIATGTAIDRFFALYSELFTDLPSDTRPREDTIEAASLSLQCLVVVASVRRATHDPLARQSFLSALMTGTEALLRTRRGFALSTECVHHACRLVARTRINSQMREMLLEPSFSRWLNVVRDFTCDALLSWSSVSPRSVSYLLEFWQGMVAPGAHLRTALSASQSGPAGNGISDFDIYGLSTSVVPVLDAYLTSRSEICEIAALSELDGSARVAVVRNLAGARSVGLAPPSGEAEYEVEDVDPLVSEEILLDELSSVVALARFRYPPAAEAIGRIILSSLSERANARQRGTTDAGAQAKLAFMMYLVGSLVGGPVSRETASVVKQLDELNIELAAMAFRVCLERSDTLLRSSFRLEMATLFFLQSFQYLMIESRTRAQVAKAEMRARRLRRWPVVLNDDAFSSITYRPLIRGSQLMSWPRSSRPAPMSSPMPIRTVIMSQPTTTGGGVPNSANSAPGDYTSGGARGTSGGGGGGMSSVPSSPSSASLVEGDDMASSQDTKTSVGVRMMRLSYDDEYSSDSDDGGGPPPLLPPPRFLPSWFSAGAPGLMEQALVSAVGSSSSLTQMQQQQQQDLSQGMRILLGSNSHQQTTGDSSGGVIVDELDAMEAGNSNNNNNSNNNPPPENFAQVWSRASVVQRTVTDRLGIPGGDKALLDLSVRHIFSILASVATSTTTSSNSSGGVGGGSSGESNEKSSSSSSSSVLLIERALGVLRRLAQGSSIVHIGQQFSPRIVSSGLLLLESDYVQELLRNPNPERFDLLRDPRHGRARSFLMTTLATLFFLHLDGQRSSSSSSSGDGFGQSGIIGEDAKITPGGVGFEELDEPMSAIPIHLGFRRGDDGPFFSSSSSNNNNNTNGNGVGNENNGGLTLAERTEERFELFMAPFTQLADDLLRMVRGGNTHLARNESMRVPLIGLLRDLRGLMAAAEDTKQYDLLYSWMFPSRIKLLQVAAKAWWDTPSVTIPLCRLVGELVMNRGSRITFSISSSAGYVLLLEAMRTLQELVVSSVAQLEARLANDAAIVGIVGEQVPNDSASRLSMLALQAVVEELTSSSSSGNSGEDALNEAEATTRGTAISLAPGAIGLGITTNPSALELKGASVACTALTRVLSCRFGSTSTLELLGDTLVRQVRESSFRLLLAGRPESISTYTKAETSLVLFAHSVAEADSLDLVKLPSPVFARLVAVVATACGRAQATLSTPAAFTVDALATLKCHALMFGEFQARVESTALPEFVVIRNDGLRATMLSPIGRIDTRSIPIAVLKEALARFRVHDETQPTLFADLISVLLDRLLTSSENELPNMYGLARPIIPLCLSTRGSVRSYVEKFAAAQAPDRQQEVAESFAPLLRLLHETDAELATNGVSPFADLLRQQDFARRELCRFARKWREAFATHLKESR